MLATLLVVTLAVWGIGLVEEYRGVETARSYWSTAQGRPGGLLYVALGDSTAQGVGASRPDRSYVGLLADDLRRRTGLPVLVVNLSASGAKVADVLAKQVPRLRTLRPDLVTVAVGGNDVRSYSAPLFAAQVDRLAAALPTGTFIADVPWFMHGRWERQADQAATVVTRSATVHGLVVVPLHDALKARGWEAMATDFAPDWFHPNDRGYRVWSNAFWSAISASGLHDCDVSLTQQASLPPLVVTRHVVPACQLGTFGSTRIGPRRATMTMPPEIRRHSGGGAEMMNGYGYMSSGDWIGVALLLMLWTLAVVVTTVWVVGVRHTPAHRGTDQQHHAHHS